LFLGCGRPGLSNAWQLNRVTQTAGAGASTRISVKYLLDVNVLLAAIWKNQPDHTKADAWVQGKGLATCPLSELGFLRITQRQKR